MRKGEEVICIGAGFFHILKSVGDLSFYRFKKEEIKAKSQFVNEPLMKPDL